MVGHRFANLRCCTARQALRDGHPVVQLKCNEVLMVQSVIKSYEGITLV